MAMFSLTWIKESQKMVNKKKLPKRLADIVDSIKKDSDKPTYNYVITNLKNTFEELADGKGAVLLRMLNQNPSELIDILDFMLKNAIRIPEVSTFNFDWFTESHEKKDALSSDEQQIYDKMKNSLFFKVYHENDFYQTINGKYTLYPNDWKNIFMSEAHQLVREFQLPTPNRLKAAALASKIDDTLVWKILEETQDEYFPDDGAQLFFNLILSRSNGIEERITNLKLLKNNRFNMAIFNYIKNNDISINELVAIPIQFLSDKKILEVMVNKFSTKLETILNKISENKDNLYLYDYEGLLKGLHDSGHLIDKIDIEKLTAKCRTGIFHYLVDRSYDKYKDESLLCQKILNLNVETDELLKMLPNTSTGKKIVTICSDRTLKQILENSKLIVAVGEWPASALNKIIDKISTIDDNYNELQTFVEHANLHSVFDALKQSPTTTSRFYEDKNKIHNKSELFNVFRNRIDSLENNEIKVFVEKLILIHDSNYLVGDLRVDLKMILRCFNQKVSKIFSQAISNLAEEGNSIALYNLNNVMVLDNIYSDILKYEDKKLLTNFALANVSGIYTNVVLNFITKSYMEKSGESKEIQDNFILSTNNLDRDLILEQKLKDKVLNHEAEQVIN